MNKKSFEKLKKEIREYGTYTCYHIRWSRNAWGDLYRNIFSFVTSGSIKDITWLEDGWEVTYVKGENIFNIVINRMYISYFSFCEYNDEREREKKKHWEDCGITYYEPTVINFKENSLSIY